MKFRKYILLFIIYVFTIFLVLYLCMLYKKSLVNVSDSNVSDFLVSIGSNDYNKLYSNISNYNMENSDYIVYVASYKYNNLSPFEGMLRDVIISKNLKNSILYVNVDNFKVSHINKLISDFSYDYSVKFRNLPIFICFHDGSIVDIVSVGDFTRDELLSFLEVYYD